MSRLQTTQNGNYASSRETTPNATPVILANILMPPDTTTRLFGTVRGRQQGTSNWIYMVVDFAAHRMPGGNGVTENRNGLVNRSGLLITTNITVEVNGNDIEVEVTGQNAGGAIEWEALLQAVRFEDF